MTIGHLTQDELRKAKAFLVRLAQQQAYPVELAVLSHNRNVSQAKQKALDKSSPLYRLTPLVDSADVLRVDGRIGVAKHVSKDLKFPVILPANHRVTSLIVDAYHRKFQHANSETVVNELRQIYYVPRLRAVVRKVVYRCNVCKLRRAVPRIPRMASLPPTRLATYTRPFTYVGLDLFGPLMVKIGRSTAKRWIALFTYFTIRAVHCEVVYSLSTDACIKSIRRFVCRRGAPAEIHTDNGTNFQSAQRMLMQEIQQDIAATFTSTVTKWMFIPPSSPHMGGAWERMVRSVKQAMMGSYNFDRKLDDESLLTLVTEAESIVNSRPLTYLPLDAEESEALTPNHFLLGCSSGIRSSAVENTSSVQAVRSSWHMIKHELDCFWKRWIREMLPRLTKRTKWFDEVKVVAVGDLVLVVDDGKRNSWIRGRVLELVPGSDGRIRQAIVRTAGGLLRRPVAKLAVLEVKGDGKTGTGGQCYGGRMLLLGHCLKSEVCAFSV
ncbi:uncharacterized protein LOC131675818 [Topomyia yanbarensis]|uniref:uncharacterized protein LOC131675818 n=1 Tax=Topomyia yanbarensis TaxID=2498891 RepID=UPI00273A9E14|nr:uncharacterized protein LOC131675818 [Topomyia yanbarensis]